MSPTSARRDRITVTLTRSQARALVALVNASALGDVASWTRAFPGSTLGHVRRRVVCAYRAVNAIAAALAPSAP